MHAGCFLPHETLLEIALAMTPGPPIHCIPDQPASDRPPGLSPQVSMATLDTEVPLTLALNLSHLSQSDHILELRPALQGLGGWMHYVVAHGNQRGLFHMRHLGGRSSLQLGRQRPRPGVYELEVVSVAGPRGVWPGPVGRALRLKVQLQLL